MNHSLTFICLILSHTDGIYVSTSDQILKYDTSSSAYTAIAGTFGSTGYSGDGSDATAAQLSYPYGLAVDSSNNVYVSDYSNHVIRKVTASNGYIDTIAGTGTAAYSGDNGQATSATLNSPMGIALDSSGNVYIAEQGNHVIRKVTVSNGIVSTVAGTGVEGYSGDGSDATSAKLSCPEGLAIDSVGT